MKLPKTNANAFHTTVLSKKLFATLLGFLLVATAVIYSTQAVAQTETKEEIIDEFKAAAKREKDTFERLTSLNQKIKQTTDEINQAEIEIERSTKTIDKSEGKQQTIEQQIEELEQKLNTSAIDEFIKKNDELLSGTELSPTEQARFETLFGFTTESTVELVARLKNLRDEKATLVAVANNAEIIRVENVQRKKEKLPLLEEQKQNLEEEWEKVKEDYDEAEAEVEAFAKEDSDIRKLIEDSDSRRSFLGESFLPPVQPACITSRYDLNRLHPKLGYRREHQGTDFRSKPAGRSTFSVADGTVIFVGNKGGYGNTVIVDHGKNRKGQLVTTLYAHFSRSSVQVGQEVKAGQEVGLSGATGTATAVHLHFEVRLDGNHTNPESFYAEGALPSCY